jgi:hypothetical protein
MTQEFRLRKRRARGRRCCLLSFSLCLGGGVMRASSAQFSARSAEEAAQPGGMHLDVSFENVICVAATQRTSRMPPSCPRFACCALCHLHAQRITNRSPTFFLNLYPNAPPSHKRIPFCDRYSKWVPHSNKRYVMVSHPLPPDPGSLEEEEEGHYLRLETRERVQTKEAKSKRRRASPT